MSWKFFSCLEWTGEKIHPPPFYQSSILLTSCNSTSYNRSVLKTSQQQCCQLCDFLAKSGDDSILLCAFFLLCQRRPATHRASFPRVFWRLSWSFGGWHDSFFSSSSQWTAGADPSLSRYKVVSGGHSLESREAHCAAVWQMLWWQEQKEFSPLPVSRAHRVSFWLFLFLAFLIIFSSLLMSIGKKAV